MNFFKNFIQRIKNFFRKVKMAKITLDNIDSEFSFDSTELIHIGFDTASQLIIICLVGQSPRYLPLTAGNLDFLQKMTPYLQVKAKRDLNAAEEISQNKTLELK